MGKPGNSAKKRRRNKVGGSLAQFLKQLPKNTPDHPHEEGEGVTQDSDSVDLAKRKQDLLHNLRKQVDGRIGESGNKKLVAEKLKEEELENGSFFKGVQLSADGKFLLSANSDRYFRAYSVNSALSRGEAGDDSHASLKHWSSSLLRETGTVYDYTLYPFFDAQTPLSCCFFSVSKGNPVHLWNFPVTDHPPIGQGRAEVAEKPLSFLRASYVPIDTWSEELVQTYSAALNASNDTQSMHLHVGSVSRVYAFDISYPGKNQLYELKLKKTRNSLTGQSGIISSIAFNPERRDLCSCGSYAGSVVLYDTRTFEPISGMTTVAEKGVSQVKFNATGNLLLVNARKHESIFVYDIRASLAFDKPLFEVKRRNDTNQRLQLDCGHLEEGNECLVTGTTDGYVKLFDLNSGAEMEQDVESGGVLQARDCVNGVSFHSSIAAGKESLLAVSTGQRHFYDFEESGSEEEVESKARTQEEECNAVILYKLNLSTPSLL